MSISSKSFSKDEVQILEAGKPAPFTGVLFPSEVAQKVRVQLIEGSEAKALNESYLRSIELYKSLQTNNDEKVNILLTQNDKLARALNDSRTVSSFEKTIWFIAGILLTGGAVYGASKLAR